MTLGSRLMEALFLQVSMIIDIGKKGKNVNHILGFQDSAQKTHANSPHISLTKASCWVKTDVNEMKSNPLQEKGNKAL